MQYQKVLQQRNAWLKLQATNPSANRTELEFYNAKMAEDGEYIHSARKAFLVRFLPLLQFFYQQLSGGKEHVDIVYQSDLLQKRLTQWFDSGLEQDLRMQRTLRGIHKDDWDFILDNTALKQFGSQGQKKSFLFALKLAQYAYLGEEQGHLPILLLDDIFEKLDQQRMEALLKIIRGPQFGQVILTDTHADRVKEAFGGGVEVGFIGL